MDKVIDHYKLKTTSWTTELDGELDADARTVVLTETEIYETAYRDNGDGTHDLIYKSKVVGATDVKQGGKISKGKSKRTQSKKLRQAMWCINPEESFYEVQMDKIIANLEEVIQFLANK